MKKAFSIFRRLAVLLLVTAWFQASTHIDVCHSDDDACGHADSATSVCSCLCHVAYINQVDEIEPTAHHEIILIPSTDQTDLGLLIPTDIFRPPLKSDI
jgi:hypothetical protein